LTKKQVEEAMKQYKYIFYTFLSFHYSLFKFSYSIDCDSSNNLTLMLNSTKKIAKIKLPKYYPFIGTSKIQVLSITDYEKSKAQSFKVNY
jgi:hypothetical protein